MMDRSNGVAFALACALAAGPLFSQGGVSPLPGVSGVVHQGGAPASGVEIILRPLPASHEMGLHDLGVPGALPEAVAQVRSDADGAFRLSAPAAGVYWLEFQFGAGGASAAPVSFCPLMPLTTPVVLGAVELPALHWLTVQVRDSDGAPVPGALVLAEALSVMDSPGGDAAPILAQPGWFEPCSPWAIRGSATTDDDGAARFLVPASGAEVTVVAPGHAPAGRLAAPGRARFRLEQDPGLRVRVRGPDGAPAPGVLVRTGASLGPPLGLTDERGEALIHLPGWRELAAQAGRRGATLKFDAADGAFARVPLPSAGARSGVEGDARSQNRAGPEEMDVELEPMARFRARVVDGQSGEGIAEAVAWLASDPGIGGRGDQFGAMYVAVWPSGADLGFAAAGYLPAELGVGLAEMEARTPVSVGLTPVVLLHGHVVDGRGRAVPNATVTAEPTAPGALADLLSAGFGGVLAFRPALSDADGSFGVTALHGSPWRLTVAARGFASTVLEVPALERGDLAPPVRLVLVRGRQVWGTVNNLAGAPISEAQVSLLRPPELESVELRAFAAAAAGPVSTNARGEFEFPNVAAGAYGLRVSHAEHVELRWQEVDVPDGEGLADLGVFTLAAGLEIHGVVNGANGRPAKDARVQGSQSPGLSRGDRGVFTDRDGRFRLAGLAEAPVDLYVMAKGHVPETVEAVRPGTGEPILIGLVAAASLAGTVLTAHGSPARDAAVRLSSTHARGDGRSQSFGVSHDGTFDARHLRPGVWSVSASDAAGGRAEGQVVELVAGEVREVELRLVPGSSLTVAVTDPQGQPVAQARVLVRPEDTRLTEWGLTDVSGRVVVGLEEGVAQVEVSHSGWRTATEDVVVGPGTNELAVRLEAGFEIAGQVRTVDGLAVQGAVVHLGPDYGAGPDSELQAMALSWSHVDDSSPRAVSDVTGRFRVTGVDPGIWRLSAMLPGHAMAGDQPRVEVESGSVAGIVIELVPEASIRGLVTGLGDAGTASARMATAEVRAWRGTHFRSTAPTLDGAFELDGLSPGEWQVSALSGDRRSPEQTVRVGVEGASEFVELRFERGLLLGGQVFAQGNAMAGAPVAVRLAAESAPRQTRTDHQGRFVFDGLPAGMVRLVVYGDSGPVGEQVLDLQGDVEQLFMEVGPLGDGQ